MSAQHLSFVLTRGARILEPTRIALAYRDLFSGVAMSTDVDGDFVTLRSSGESVTYVAVMPAQVPNGEAEEFSRYSYASLLGAEPVQEHDTHAIVITRSTLATPLDSLGQHIRHTAAVAQTLDAVGIYDGNAGATHLTPFYVSCAQSEELPSPLITGLSVGQESPDRLSILTKGLTRLGLREFLITVPAGDAQACLDYLLDLVSYVVGRREQLGDGETVGRTAEESFLVTHRASPTSDSEEVVSIDFAKSGDA